MQALGLLFLVIASAFTGGPFTGGPLFVLRDTVWYPVALAMGRVYCEAFLALALWQFVWLFPREPRARWARTIGKLFLAGAGAVSTLPFATTSPVPDNPRP